MRRLSVLSIHFIKGSLDENTEYRPLSYAMHRTSQNVPLFNLTEQSNSNNLCLKFIKKSRPFIFSQKNVESRLEILTCVAEPLFFPMCLSWWRVLEIIFPHTCSAYIRFLWEESTGAHTIKTFKAGRSNKLWMSWWIFTELFKKLFLVTSFLENCVIWKL